jgi:hypothetical protein
MALRRGAGWFLGARQKALAKMRDGAVPSWSWLGGHVLALEKMDRRLARLAAGGLAQRSAQGAKRLRQRGTAMVVTLIALTGLGTLGTITMLSVEGGMTAAAADRSHAIAVYAAESGIMAGLHSVTPDAASGFTDLLLPGLTGNRVMPGGSGNAFSPSMQAWYDVELKASQSNPNGRVIFVSTGYGPNRATATIEAEVFFFFDGLVNRYVILSWREVE